MAKPMGRPTVYDKIIFDKICEEISEGKSLTSIAKQDNFPRKITFYRWLRENKDLCIQYGIAKEDRADTITDQIIDIADGKRSEQLQLFNTNIEALRLEIARFNTNFEELNLLEVNEVQEKGMTFIEKFMTISKELVLIINKEDVQRSRLMVEARKWIASKLHPRNYGDKTTFDFEATDLNVKININVINNDDKLKLIKNNIKLVENNQVVIDG